MKLSVSIWSVHNKIMAGQMDNLDFIRFCHKNGVKYVELSDQLINHQEDEIKNLLIQLGMQVSSYSISNDFTKAISGGRESQVKYVLDSIDNAVSFGAKFIRVFCGNGSEGIDFYTAKKWVVESFNAVASYAEEKGITLVIENIGVFMGSSSQVKAVIEEVGSQALRSNADIANFLGTLENPVQALENLKDYIGFVHFKDFTEVDRSAEGYASIDGRKYQGTVLGKGQVPMKKCIIFLSEIGYNGFLSIEYEGIGDEIDDTIESIKYSKSIMC